MSPRNISSDVQTAVASAAGVEFVHLIELEFASGEVRLCTGAQDLSWSYLASADMLWEAVGGLLEIGGVEETSDSRGQGVDLKLSGVNRGVLELLLASNYRGRPVKIWRAYLDRTTGLVIEDPVLFFRGLQLSPYTIEEQRDRAGGTVTISTRLQGFFGVSRVRGIMTNLASHQQEYNGDMFFQHTPALGNVKIYWGTTAPLALNTSGSPIATKKWWNA